MKAMVLAMKQSDFSRRRRWPAVLTAVFVFCLTAMAAAAGVSARAPEDNAIGWYFKKTSDHSLPPLDAALSYIEQYGGYYADRNASAEDPVIYLTFDAGYENGNIAKILDILKKHNAPAAFFVLSHLIEAEPALVCRMAEEGHIVCNHTASHRDITTLDSTALKEELSSLAALYRETTGRDMALYFRPPEGRFDRASLACVQDMGYRTVFWSLAYADWDNKRQPDPDTAMQNLLDHTHNGMVLLLHPTSDTNVQILDRLLCAWEEQGYRIGTLDELTAKVGESS